MRLDDLFAPEVVAAFEALVSERVADALANVPTPEDDPWLTREQAARRVHVELRTLDRYLATGRIESGYFGGRRLIRRSALDAFVERS